MAGFLQAGLVMMRAFGTYPAYCKKCNQKETFKEIGADGTHTYLCGCGCTIYKYHPADEFHKSGYFIKTFISKGEYNRKHKNKDLFEKIGFEKIEQKNGIKVYTKAVF